MSLGSLFARVLGFLRRDRGSCILFFVVGFILRGIPELLVPDYPVGFETITYYAPAMITFPKRGLLELFSSAFLGGQSADIQKPLLDTFRAGPLFYVFTWFVPKAGIQDVYIALKVIGPLLYGIVTVSFFIFLRHGLRFSWKTAFASTLLLVLQVAALRESWDRFRTVLGLVFLFTTLIALKSSLKFKWWLVAILGLLTVLSREYVGLVLLVAVAGFAVLERKNRAPSFLAMVPAIAVFVLMSYPSWLWWNLLLPENPFAVTGSWWRLQDVFSIFAVCYFLLLPFVLKGFWRNRLLDPIFCFLLIGSFSAAVNPWFAVPGYQRWLVLLVFPFCVYAVKGFERLDFFDQKRVSILKGFVFIFILIGAGYSTGAFSYSGMLANSYVPVNLVQSSIPWDQVDDVRAALAWLDQNAKVNSCLLVKEYFYGWTLIYFGRAHEDVKVVPYGSFSSPWSTLEKVLEEDFAQICLMWYTNQSLRGFDVLYTQNDISVFYYELQPVLNAKSE